MIVTRPIAGLISNLSNVYQVKRFKTKEAYYKFIATADNSLNWKLHEDKDIPSGYYRTQIDSKSFRYINVKTDRVYSFNL